MGAKGSVLKRVRQSKKANILNNHYKSMMKSAIKKISLNKEVDQQDLNKAISVIDKVCGKGIIHKNRAARYKSKLYKHSTN
tara:strand:- start:2103 stop:2345 length:243 start_codon:yes stop_codon:yes gene_type:complete